MIKTPTPTTHLSPNKRNARVPWLLALGMAFISGSPDAASSDPYSTADLVAKTPAGSVARPLNAQPCGTDDIAGATLTLADVVERALCSNPQTREAWANAKVQAAQLGVSQGAYLPSLNASAALSRVHADGRNFNGGGDDDYSQATAALSLDYLLYDFGARNANHESARQLLAALNATQDATLQSVFLAAVRAYYQLFATHASVEAAMETEKSSAVSLQAAVARYDVGVATPADKLQAQTAHAQAMLNRIRAEGDVKVAQGTLANTLGLDADQPLSIARPVDRQPDESVERRLADLIAEARRRRPDLAAAEAQIRAAEAGVELSRASGLPTISLTANLNRNDTGANPAFSTAAAGVSVSVPLFSGFSTRYRVRAAEAQVEVRAAQRDRLAQQIALDVWNAYYGLNTESAAVKSSAILLDSALQSERVALGRYQSGVGSILDLLTAQSALAGARQQYIQSHYDWYIARATLAHSLGQLDFTTLTPPAAEPAP